jgi:hypothetical protein
MTEAARRAALPGWLWPVLLLGILVLAILLDDAVPDGALRVANPDTAAADGMDEALAAVPEDGLVLVALDPDLGTYPEIRPTVRALLDALRAANARLAVVSYTVEGRAVAVAELGRLREAGAPDDRLLDLGFVAGAEAGMVLSVTQLAAAEGVELPSAFAEASGGVAAFDLAVVVGGIDIGPRSWVEQVATRVPELPIVVVVPTVLHPEVAPYVRSGQLDALLGTLRDGTAYARESGHAAGAASPTGLLVGMLLALLVIGRTAWRAQAPGSGVLPDATEDES